MTIKKKLFTVTYDVYDGMSWEDVCAKENKASRKAMERINRWKGTRKIISIQEKTFKSYNSDQSPFSVTEIVFYDE